MKNRFLGILKKYRFVLVLVVSVVVLFVAYNVYLLDYSLANLKGTLEKLDDVKTLQDAQRLAAALDYALLKEASLADIEPATLSKLEAAKEILAKPQSLAQLEEVKAVLKEVIEQKEKQRMPVLRALDRVSQAITPISTESPRAQIEAELRRVKERLLSASSSAERQSLSFELGTLYTRIRDFRQARDAFDRALYLDAGSALADRIRFNRAWCDKQLGNLNESAKQFEQLISLSQDEKLVRLSKYQLAEVLRQNKQYAKAIELYQQIASQGKESDLAQLATVKVGSTYLYDLQEFDKARQALEKAGASGKTAGMEGSAFRSIASQYRKKGFRLLSVGFEEGDRNSYQEAVKAFDKALEINAQDGIANTGKALAYLWMNDPDRALGFARQAVKYLPNSEVASVNLGYIYIQLGIIEEAIVEYKRFIGVNPFTAHGYFNLGYAYILSGRLDEALAAYEKATTIDPRFSRAFNNLGWCLWQLGNYGRSIETFEKTVLVDPGYTDALFNLGLIYKTIGRFQDSKKKFEQLTRLRPDYPRASQYLKELEEYLGK